jgi:hypothetical protein
MSVEEAIEAYGTLVKKVFRDGRKVTGDGKFRASILEDVIKRIVKEKTGDADSRMLNDSPDGQACKTYHFYFS